MYRLCKTEPLVSKTVRFPKEFVDYINTCPGCSFSEKLLLLVENALDRNYPNKEEVPFT